MKTPDDTSPNPFAPQDGPAGPQFGSNSKPDPASQRPVRQTRPSILVGGAMFIGGFAAIMLVTWITGPMFKKPDTLLPGMLCLFVILPAMPIMLAGLVIIATGIVASWFTNRGR